MKLKDRLIRGFETALGIRDNAAVVAYVETGQGALPGEASVIVWSIDSIHSYVFDTGNAAAIRGASQILEDFDKRTAEGREARDSILPIAPEQILYCGGGGGMAVVASSEVEAVEAALHRAVTLKTLSATCSFAAAPLSIGSFRQLKSVVYQRLSRYRTLAGTDATVPMQFFELPCQVCGRRAAAVNSPRKNFANRQECILCQHRIEVARKDISEGAESLDFEKIEAASGELGVIYLDGNRMGDTLAALASPFDYARFSSALNDCLSKVVDDAIEAYELKIDPKGKERGFQVPIQGGDDLVMIVPGDVAVPMARDLLKDFENATDANTDLDELRQRPLGASAGVAVGRLPIRHLLDEAEAFLESAKNRTYRDEKTRSCLDFGVISDGQPRRSGHVAPRLAAKKGTSLLFSAKPYDLRELESFSERRARIQDAKTGIAPSQLHACRRMAEAGPNQLRNHLLYQIGRHEGWKKLVCDLAKSEKPLTDPDEAFSTLVPSFGDQPVFDIADMLEFDGLWREPTPKEAVS